MVNLELRINAVKGIELKIIVPIYGRDNQATKELSHVFSDAQEEIKAAAFQTLHPCHL
jgi:hypothetical protein